MSKFFIESTIATSILSHPIEREWCDVPDAVVLHAAVSLDDVREHQAVAFINAVDAVDLVHTDDYRIITDVALVSEHIGTITLTAKKRFDEIEHARIGFGDASRTAEALARATLRPFYGVNVMEWSRRSEDVDILVTDDLRELIEGDDTEEDSDRFEEDLLRAWFILSGQPLPTHVLTAPAPLIEDKSAIREYLNTLETAIRTGQDRRREIRRNISHDHGINRDVLNELHSDQKFSLGKDGRDGLIELVARTGHEMSLKRINSDAFATLGPLR